MPSWTKKVLAPTESPSGERVDYDYSSDEVPVARDEPREHIADVAFEGQASSGATEVASGLPNLEMILHEAGLSSDDEPTPISLPSTLPTSSSPPEASVSVDFHVAHLVESCVSTDH